MVDPLIPSTRPQQATETVSNSQRLVTLLASGQPRTAQVVQTTLQLPATSNTTPSNPASATLSPTTDATTAPSTATPSTAASASGATTTAANLPSPPTTQTDVFKIQIRIEGRLFELLTNKPLDPGSSIQLSRGSDNRILLQQLPATPLQQPVPINSAIERVAIATLLPEIAIRIGPGERLNGEVLSSRASPAAANIDPGNHQIRINLQQGHQLEFVSPRPLPQGTQVALVRDHQGQLWAELPSATTRAIEQALREHLPQQQPPAALLNLLSSAQTNGQLQQANPVLFSLFQILLGGSLTRPLQTNAASVKQQVQNSGTLLESKLAQSNTQNINQDHKAILLKVIRQLGQSGNQRELPAALSERINALTQQALSRVLVNQITSLGTQAQDTGAEQNRTLALDIPILWQGKTENLHLKIKRDAYTDSAETEAMLYRWQVRLNFEVDENRILEAELTLEAEQISILWSGDAVLRQRLEKQLDQLQQRLESIGLKIKTLGIRERLPETGNRPTPPRSQLIDITT